MIGRAAGERKHRIAEEYLRTHSVGPGEADKTHARASAPDHRYYAAVKDRKDGKRTAISEARKFLRQACHILAELGDDALARA